MISLQNSQCHSPKTTLANINENENQQSFQQKFIPIYSEMRARQQKAIETAGGSMKADSFFSFVHLSNNSSQNFPSSNSHPYVPSLLSSTSSKHDKGKEEKAVQGKANKHDSRRCLAISSIIHKDHCARMDWTPAFLELQGRLSKLPGLHFVEDSENFQLGINAECFGQLHWTLMQLVGFNDYSDQVEKPASVGQSPFLQSKYLDIVQSSLFQGGLDCTITIEFIGVIAVSTGLLMVGIPSIDINDARDNVRNNLKKNDVPLLEPFINDIVHSTLFRVVSTDDSDNNEEQDIEAIVDQNELSQELLDISRTYETVSLGKVSLSKFQIGPASWRMLASEIKETPPLREWKLNN